MPDMDGYAVRTGIKRSPSAGIPTIFLTSWSGAVGEEKELKIRAVDYLAKPVNPAILLARVATHLKLKEERDILITHNAVLKRKVNQQTQKLVQSQQATIVVMGLMAEFRDPETACPPRGGPDLPLGGGPVFGNEEHLYRFRPCPAGAVRRGNPARPAGQAA